MIHGESYKPIVAEAARKAATKVYNRIMVTLTQIQGLQAQIATHTVALVHHQVAMGQLTKALDLGVVPADAALACGPVSHPVFGSKDLVCGHQCQSLCLGAKASRQVPPQQEQGSPLPLVGVVLACLFGRQTVGGEELTNALGAGCGVGDQSHPPTLGQPVREAPHERGQLGAANA